MEGSITDDASFPADVYTLTAPLVSPHAIDLPSGENAIDKMSPFERMERRIIIQNIRFRRSQAYTTMWQPTNLATLIWEVCAINIPSAITLFKHYPLPYFPRCFKICVWNVSNKNINKIKEERDLHCLAQKHSQAHFKPLCCWWYGQGTSMFVSLSSCIHHIFGTRHPKAKSYTVSRRRFTKKYDPF